MVWSHIGQGPAYRDLYSQNFVWTLDNLPIDIPSAIGIDLFAIASDTLVGIITDLAIYFNSRICCLILMQGLKCFCD